MVFNGREFKLKFANFDYQANLIASIGVANDGDCPFSNGPDQTTPFPAAFEIEYIRVYNRLDCDKVINLTNYYQADTDPTIITGKEISFSHSTLNSDKSLSLIATDQVVIGQGTNIAGEFQAKTVECPGPPFDLAVKEQNNTLLQADTLGDIIHKTTRSFSELKEESFGEPIGVLKNSILNKSKPILYTRIFPNPTSGSIELEFEGDLAQNIKIEVLDATGKNVFCQDAIREKDLHIDLSYLPKGTYFLIGTFGDRSVTEKVILK